MNQTERGRPFPFGATALNGGVNFAIYIKNADKLNLCLFHENDVSQPFQEIALDAKEHKTGHVWHVFVRGLPESFIYGYRVPSEGKSGSEHPLILDPHAKGVASHFPWVEKPAPDLTYKPLGKFFTDHFDWEGDKPLNIPIENLIIYEMHVRGFTCHPTSHVEHPGTYLGIVEKIPYLLDLGINAVELLPIHEFNEFEAIPSNPITGEKLHNYFGYSTVNFFSPMSRYGSSPEGSRVIQEFKTLVKELHKNGIEVILDVVFNHTFEGNELGPSVSFKSSDAQAYYMINGEGNHLNFSGCGNTFNCNHPVTRELIIEALRYWVLEMHVDGFRFDLASIFYRAADGTPLENPPLVEAISNDPILASTKLIAEAWDPGGLYHVGAFAPHTKRWSEWNGKYRDVVRRFIKGGGGEKNSFAGVLSGSHDLYGSRSSGASINFVTAHDGYSLADLVSYQDKHNEANGEENRDGTNDNESWNCGFEGATDSKKVSNLRKKQVRNFFLALMVSRGVPMVLMGDEYAHTRKGNNNTWCQDNELNWFLWDLQKEREKGFYRFCRLLIHFRRAHPLLSKNEFFKEGDVHWHGSDPENPKWDHDNHLVAFSLHTPDGAIGLYIAFNADHVYHNLTLPPAGENKLWEWVVNTNNLPPDDFFEPTERKFLEGEKYRIPPYSSIMLESRPKSM